MGVLNDLIESSSHRISRVVNSQLMAWILAISTTVETLVSGTGVQAQTRYVDKGGNDVTGTGSFESPFLTIQRAITSITDATAAKTYSVEVGPGTYIDTFAISPFIYVKGVNQLACILNPTTANWITAGFAAGAQDAGLSNFTLLTPFVCNFAAVGSTGAGTFMLSQILLGTGGTITAQGNNAANIFSTIDIAAKNAANATYLTLTQIAGVHSGTNLRSGNCVITSTDAYVVVVRAAEVFTGGSLTVTWTGANTANFLSVIAGRFLLPGGLNITGAAASVTSLDVVFATMPDADTSYSFGAAAVGATVVLPSRARTYIRAALTANRTIQFQGPVAAGTDVIVKNESAFFISITYSAGVSGAGTTFIPPFMQVRLWASNGVAWEVDSIVQSGTVVLVNGVSPAIPADITASASITVTPKIFNGAAGVAAALNADRVVGNKGAGGLFVVKSIAQATGAVVATDLGTYDWHVRA